MSDSSIAKLLNVAPEEIQLVSPWERAGSETYIAIVKKQSDSRLVVAKACIKFCATETMNEWLGRRAQVDALGLSTPELLATGDAILAEEYIPYTLRDAYNLGDDDTKTRLRISFVHHYLTLVRNGFSPLSFHDIRSRGSDIVQIDFGEDLGPSRKVNAVENMSTEAIVIFDKLIT